MVFSGCSVHFCGRDSITEDGSEGGPGLHVPPFPSCSTPTTSAPSSNSLILHIKLPEAQKVSLCTLRAVEGQDKEGVASATFTDLLHITFILP